MGFQGFFIYSTVKDSAKAGDTLKLMIDGNRLHLFDKETEGIIARV